jgi:glucoamylase
MPRDLPLGNGSLLVTFDANYQIRDLYWPHVGQENHTLGHPNRVGVWVEDKFRWLDDPTWKRSLVYAPGTLLTDVTLENPDLLLTLHFSDAVDFHENVLVRKIQINSYADHDREVRIYFHHDFHIAGNEVGDTAYYEPDRRAVLHYKNAYWFLINGAVMQPEGEPKITDTSSDTLPGLMVGIHQWACGNKEIHDLQGTWRDAEDGYLEGSAVAHGSVDSVVGFLLQVRPMEARTLYTWLAVGDGFEEVTRLNRMLRQRGPESFLERTRSYWTLWLDMHTSDMGNLPQPAYELYTRSLLILRTQVDNGGAIIAANDTDISSDVRDTYSYMWGRDGALTAHAFTQAGFIDIPRQFFLFCADAMTKEGYLLHKYNPDGTLASSWHPWYRDGIKQIPLQEDETALVLWALWEHFNKYHDVEFIKPLYRPMIRLAGDFLVAHIIPKIGLPLPSYDLWEEREGILGWTAAATWAGLRAAERFAKAFGELEAGHKYHEAAHKLKKALEAHLWKPELNYFARMVNRTSEGEWLTDDVIDSSIMGLWMFDMYAPDDQKMCTTIEAVRRRLWVKTNIGGLARYEDDHYQQVSKDIENVAGNPWFISTLWLSEWTSKTARAREELEQALELILWVTKHALPSGVLAEQVDPYTGAPISVSPLTWSHAAFISAVHAYLEAEKRLESPHAKDYNKVNKSSPRIRNSKHLREMPHLNSEGMRESSETRKN